MPEFHDRPKARCGSLHLAVLPAAVLFAATFPVIALAREPGPGKLEGREQGLPHEPAAPAPVRVAQESSEPPADEPERFEIAPTTVEAPPEPGLVAREQSTATKTAIPLRETPQSVSVITRESLEARQVRDLGQALELAAGVTQYSGAGPYGGTAAWGFTSTTIRGIDLDGANDIREDGFISGTYFATPDLAVYDRIEVVKGPSSLYGRGSAGGFVNRVRKTPLSEAMAEIGATFGSFDLYRIDADLTGPVAGTETVRARFVAAYEDSGSFVDEVETERALIAPSVEIDVTPTTLLTVHGLYQDESFIPTNGFPLRDDGTRFRAPRIRRSKFIGIPNREENEWEILSGTAELEQQLGDSWLATLRFNASSIDTPNELDGYAYGVLSPEGDTTVLSSDYPIDRDIWMGELRVQGTVDVLGRALDVAAGVDRSDLDYSRAGAYAEVGAINVYADDFDDLSPASELTTVQDGTTDAEDTGVYFQTRIRPIERLSVLLGGRYEWTETIRKDELADSRSKQDDSAFTGRAGLVFDVTERISAYALYAQSFQPVIFSEGRDGPLDPEEGDIWEVGLKTFWLENRLVATAAAFRIDRDDIPITDPDNGPGEFFSVSSGLQRSDGVELEVQGEPLPGWIFAFAGSLLDSEFEERSDPFFGTKPGGTADWQVGFFTSYELQRGLLRGLGGGVGVFAIDERGVSTFIRGAVLPGYERVDLSLFYEGYEPLRLALQVRNVFDARYVEGVDRPNAYAQFGSPTAVMLEIQGRFDGEWLRKVGDLVHRPETKARG